MTRKNNMEDDECIEGIVSVNLGGRSYDLKIAMLNSKEYFIEDITQELAWLLYRYDFVVALAVKKLWNVKRKLSC